MNATGLLVLCAITAPAQAGNEFYQDLRGGALPPALKIFGPTPRRFVRHEARGLRVTFPAERPNTNPVGISPQFAIGGDFDITLRYEILSAEQPQTGYGVGVNMYLVVGKPLQYAVGLARYLHPKKGNAYVVNRTWADDEGKQRNRIFFFPTETKAGSLRLKRTGERMSVLVAEGSSKEFQELGEFEFSEGDLRELRCGVNTGKAPVALDARLVDLRIDAASLPNEAAPLPESGSGMLWWLLGGGAIVLGAVGFGVWRWRQREHARK